MAVSFVGTVFRHAKVDLAVYSIELRATDSVWTTAEGLLPQLGGVYVTIMNRTVPSHVLFDRCRFHGQVYRLYALSLTFSPFRHSLVSKLADFMGLLLSCVVCCVILLC